jgi:hypothetical protein
LLPFVYVNFMGEHVFSFRRRCDQGYFGKARLAVEYSLKDPNSPPGVPAFTPTRTCRLPMNSGLVCEPSTVIDGHECFVRFAMGILVDGNEYPGLDYLGRCWQHNLKLSEEGLGIQVEFGV